MKSLLPFIFFLCASPAWAEGVLDDLPQDLDLDRGHFGEVVTENESNDKALKDAEDRPAGEHLPTYVQLPVLTLVTQVAGGLFTAGSLGVLGGVLGDKLDHGDSNTALGGFHGPAIGAVLGATGGMFLGYWGAGLLFERQVNPGYVAIGTGAGMALGTTTAVLFAHGLGKGDTANAVAIASLLAFELGGATLFTYLYEPAPKRIALDVDRFAPAHASIFSDCWFSIPLLSRNF